MPGFITRQIINQAWEVRMGRDYRNAFDQLLQCDLLESIRTLGAKADHESRFDCESVVILALSCSMHFKLFRFVETLLTVASELPEHKDQKLIFEREFYSTVVPDAISYLSQPDLDEEESACIRRCIELVRHWSSGPALPAGLDAKATEEAVVLTWTASEGAIEYVIYRDERVWATSTETTYVDQGLTANTEREYFVVAKNREGRSWPSNGLRVSIAGTVAHNRNCWGHA
jgi:hypothetical protein